MDIKEVINRLQSIDAKDFKNIDFRTIQNKLLEKQENLIIFLLIISTVFATIYCLNKYLKNVQNYNSEIVLLKEQVQAADETKISQASYDEFIKNFPKSITINELRDKLTEFSFNRNIKILSFAPEKTQENEFYQSTMIRLMVSSAQYSQIIDFINDIENAPFAVRTEEVTARLQIQNMIPELQKTEDEKKEIIEMDIKLLSLNIKK